MKQTVRHCAFAREGVMFARKPWLGGGMLVGALLAWPGVAALRAQNAPPPAAPVPIVAPLPAAPYSVAPPPAVGPAPALGAPVPFVPPAASTPLTYAPPTAPPPPSVDPGANGWGPYEPPSTPPGWFTDAQIELVYPVLKDRISNDVPVLPSGNQLHVPATPLNLTVSPTLEVGYRLPDSAGLFAGSYRFLDSDGNGNGVVAGNSVAVHTRVDLQVLDLDYGTTFYEVAPHWNIAWRLGARLTDVFFDSQITSVPLSQQASNFFLGAGPHGRLDVERSFDFIKGLSLFGRLDGAVLIGQVKQNYHEWDLQADGTTVYSFNQVRHSQSVPNLLLEAGVSYVPPILTNFKITTGYQFEQYWYLGQFGFNDNGTASTSRGELWSHGWFLRGEYDF
jgi:hypothetical protein